MIQPMRSFGIVNSDDGEEPPPANGGDAVGPDGGRMLAKWAGRSVTKKSENHQEKRMCLS